MYFGLLDSIELSFYPNLIDFENLPFKPQIFTKTYVFGLDSILISMRFNFNLNLDGKTNQRVCGLHLKLIWKTGLGPKCIWLPICCFLKFCRILVLQNSPRRAWARTEFGGIAWARLWASLGDDNFEASLG